MRCHVQRRRKVHAVGAIMRKSDFPNMRCTLQLFSIEPLAKQTNAQSVTQQSSAKQTQAKRLMVNRQLLKRYKPDRQCYTDTPSTLALVPLAHTVEKGIFSSTELQQRITCKTRRNLDKKVVIITSRMAHATAVQDMLRTLNEVELH